ncbi:MAG: hypothetical protein H0U45_11710 [Tatlockia sp.]|jgi:hypothetical protein|nr:hypothetical protein [Tatlockia sp.]
MCLAEELPADLRGKIKSVRTDRTEETIIFVENSEKYIETKSADVVTFDDAGNEIEKLNFRNDESVVSRRVSEYDEVNRLKFRKTTYSKDKSVLEESYSEGLPTSVTHVNSDGIIQSKTEQVYDPRRRLVYSASFDSGGNMLSQTAVKYDRFNNKTVETTLSGVFAAGGLSERLLTANLTKIHLTAELVSLIKVQYTADSNPVSATFYDAKHSLIKEYRFSYEPSGLLSESNEYVNPANIVLQNIEIPGFLKSVLFTLHAVYHYAVQGRLQQSVQSVFDIPLFNTVLYHWNAAGKIVLTYEYSFGKLSRQTNFTYGTNGESLQETMLDENNLVFQEQTYEWEYDERGNWIKQIKTELAITQTLKESKQVKTVVRTIDYSE